jgi:hypothetical protein
VPAKSGSAFSRKIADYSGCAAIEPVEKLSLLLRSRGDLASRVENAAKLSGALSTSLQRRIRRILAAHFLAQQGSVFLAPIPFRSQTHVRSG